jgi:hypothetical protein
LSASNFGVLAGVDPNKIFDDIRQAIPRGKRGVPDREIADAVNKALSDHRRGPFIPKQRPVPVVADGEKTLKKIIQQGTVSNDADLWESSPIRLLDGPENDPSLLLKSLFNYDDLIWIGDRVQPGILGDTIRTASDWIAYFEQGGKTFPHVIINPLSGELAPTKGGDQMTRRGDCCVKGYKYCLVEFDGMSRENQIRFWSAAKLPVVCLIDTAGKSIHAWVDVLKLAKVETAKDWESQIRGHLYDRILKPLGVDGACSNPARLSRLPGHFRTEKKRMQRILWLSKEGRPIDVGAV